MEDVMNLDRNHEEESHSQKSEIKPTLAVSDILN